MDERMRKILEAFGLETPDEPVEPIDRTPLCLICTIDEVVGCLACGEPTGFALGAWVTDLPQRGPGEWEPNLYLPLCVGHIFDFVNKYRA